MCGIYGFSGFSDEKFLHGMQETMIHRGPDDHDTWTSEEDKVSLGHNRLSIIDLRSVAKQPLFNEDGSIVLVFNGEIYNYKELREELLAKGHEFKTEGDSEVIVHLYEEEGTNLVNRLRGMFAFAIYDTNKKELIIARDHFGIKPLYIAQTEDAFLFASEMKAMVQSEKLDFELDEEAIYDHLSFLWCPAPKSILKGVKKLDAGTLIVIKDSKIVKTEQYYQQDYAKLEEPSIEEAIERVDELFEASVKEQLMSDVPLGLFLSGGLDSSIIAAYVRKLKPEGKIKAFTIDVKEKNLDGTIRDLPYAEKVAKHLDIDLEVITVTPEDIFNYIEEFIYIMDEPLADPAAINVLLITKLAKELGYKVLLGGAGGDDIFSGYRRHQGIIMDKKMYKVPKVARKLMGGIMQKVKVDNPKLRRVKKYTYGIGDDINIRILKYFEWLPEERKERLFTEASKQKLKDYNSNQWILENNKEDFSKGLGVLDRMLRIDSKYFLIDHNLNYTDKMSMYNSIESRVPFLDYRMVDYVDKLPESYKFREGEGKWILKKVAEKYLPKEIIYRSKTGFGTPLRAWTKVELQPLFKKYMSKEKVEQAGIFNFDEIQTLMNDNNSGKIDAAYPLFSLLCIHLWLDKFSTLRNAS